MTKEWWIVIPNWEKFQHYSNRTPPWIKAYTAELIHSPEYRGLPMAARGVLHGLWAHYALARGMVRADTKELSSTLGATVKLGQLKSLNDAGFIDIVASKPLAHCYQDASTRALAREDKKREGLKPDLSSAKPTTTRAAAALPLEGSRSAPALSVVEDPEETDEEYDARAISFEEFLKKADAGELPWMAEDA